MTHSANIQLNLNRIKHVPFNTYDEDFTFVVNGEHYQTSKIVCDLISPTICQMHHNDPTINTFTINTSNEGNFSNFLNLINFEVNHISESDLGFFCEVSRILGITSQDINNFHEEHDINESNVIELIRTHELFSDIYAEQLEREIDIVSSNFFKFADIHSSDLIHLKTSTLDRIIDNDHLKLESEDQLLTFIIGVITESNKSDSWYLLEHVLFCNVSSAVMSSFVDIIDSDIDRIDRSLWRSISSRLRLPVSVDNRNQRTRYEGKFISSGNATEFCGIISHMRSENNNDISSRIGITASSTLNSNYLPSNVTIYEERGKDFYSEDQANSWIKFEFKSNKVVPRSYQVMSYHAGQNGYHPKSWVIEGSNSGEDDSWVTLDSRNNCAELNGPYKTQIFEISNGNTEEFRFIRMRLTGPDWANYNYLKLSAFEIYGELI